MSGYHCFSMKTTTAKKRHKCIYCGQMIEPSDTYEREKSVYDNAYQNLAWHPECLEDQREAARQGDMEFSPYSAERPEPIAPTAA